MFIFPLQEIESKIHEFDIELEHRMSSLQTAVMAHFLVYVFP